MYCKSEYYKHIYLKIPFYQPLCIVIILFGLVVIRASLANDCWKLAKNGVSWEWQMKFIIYMIKY